jgi:pimeloyl-ACP methyl ester carboxylesterase
MDASSHQTGKIQSGDVALFYRAFGLETGSDGTAPLVILHGSNYFDSYDWIEVASGIARSRRPVVVFDHRGSGLSEWSKCKDYSLDALFSDIVNVSAHFGWKRPAIMGHSVSGRLGIFFAAYFPDHLSQLIVADTAMGKGNPGTHNVSVGNTQKVFKTIEDAMAHLAKKENPPRFSLDRKRAELAMKKVEGGYVLTRDPDQKNTQSQAPGALLPKYTNVDSWEALGQIKCPTTFIRGKRSDRNKPEHYARVAREFPEIRVETIDSRHDLAFEAPDELIEIVNRVLIDRPTEQLPRSLAQVGHAGS